MLTNEPIAQLPSAARLEAYLKWLTDESRAARDYLRAARRVEKWRADRPLLTYIETKNAEADGVAAIDMGADATSQVVVADLAGEARAARQAERAIRVGVPITSCSNPEDHGYPAHDERDC